MTLNPDKQIYASDVLVSGGGNSSVEDKLTTIKTCRVGSSGELEVAQYGRVVTINGYMQVASITAGDVITIGNVGICDPPRNVIRGTCIVCQNAWLNGDVAYMSISTDGVISITAPTARTNWYVRTSITYIA